MHPIIGVVGLVGGAIVLIVAVAAEFATRGTGARAARYSAMALDFANGMTRQRSAMTSMGIVQTARNKWLAIKNRSTVLQLAASNRDGGFAAASRALRQGLQMAVLAFGAMLAISQQISPGSVVAGSIILARALGPIDQIVGGWRSLVQSATAWGHLRENIGETPTESDFTPLPKPNALLRLDRLTLISPGATAPLIRPFSLEVTGGQSYTIVGANGAGKTTLLQTLAGAVGALSGRRLSRRTRPARLAILRPRSISWLSSTRC